MRYLPAVALVLAACGGGDVATAAECDAVRQIVTTAAQAYEAENGAPPDDMAAMVGDTIDPDVEWLDWFTVADGQIVPATPCA
jgi:hypothetical protein